MLQKKEPWESSKSEPDMEKYVWEGSPSQLGVKRLGKESCPEVEDYSEAVVKLHNEGEDSDTVNQYKQAVKALLGRKWHVGVLLFWVMLIKLLLHKSWKKPQNE